MATLQLGDTTQSTPLNPSLFEPTPGSGELDPTRLQASPSSPAPLFGGDPTDSFLAAEDPTIFEIAATPSGVSSIYDVANGQGTLRQGDRGPGVAHLRSELDALGFRPGNGGDNYDAALADAVRGFETAYARPVDGVFDQADANALAHARSGLAGRIPAGQTWGQRYGHPQVAVPVSGYWGDGRQVRITGAFMEGQGHGPKGPKHAVFLDNSSTVVSLPAANRNLGIDYVALDANGQTYRPVHNWLGGEVKAIQSDPVFGGNGAEGYGRRIVVETDVSIPIQGQDGQVRNYPLMLHYGHLASFESGLQVGHRVEPGEVVAQMGGSGRGGDGQYPDHVDFRSWVETPDYGRVDIDPNLFTGRAAIENFSHWMRNLTIP